MRRRVALASAVAGLLAVLAFLAWPDTVPETAPPAPSMDAPSLVVVIGCTVRRDVLVPWGGPPEVAPHLSALAERGAVFDDLVAAAPWTKGSAVALLTGRHALRVGMVESDVGRNNRVLPARVSTLAERLGAAGWQTVGGTHNPNLDPVYGLARGFERYVPTDGRIVEVRPHGVDLIDAVLGEVDGVSSEAPLYLQVVLADAHAPITATPEELASLPPAPASLAVYRAAVHRLDAAVGRLLDGLEARGRDPSEMVVVFVADHGEGLGLPGESMGHGFDLDPSLLSIPGIVAGPGVARGHRVGGITSHLDLVPTLLALLGQPPADLPGVDVSAALGGEASSRRSRAFSDTWFYGANRAAVVTSNWWCQEDYGSERPDRFVAGCFDRRSDLQRARPQARLALQGDLHRWRQEGIEAGSTFSVRDASVGDTTRSWLEALGYLER